MTAGNARPVDSGHGAASRATLEPGRAGQTATEIDNLVNGWAIPFDE